MNCSCSTSLIAASAICKSLLCRCSQHVVFPQPLWPLVSDSVLVETFEEGYIVRDFVYSDSPYNRSIAHIGLQAFLQMMLQVCICPIDISLDNYSLTANVPVAVIGSTLSMSQCLVNTRARM